MQPKHPITRRLAGLMAIAGLATALTATGAAAQARAQDWRVLATSPKATMAQRWAEACEEAHRNVEDGRKPSLFDLADEF